MEFAGMPATLMTEIKRTIAVVDSSLFGNDWIDSRKAVLLKCCCQPVALVHVGLDFPCVPIANTLDFFQATARNEEGTTHSSQILNLAREGSVNMNAWPCFDVQLFAVLRS